MIQYLIDQLETFDTYLSKKFLQRPYALEFKEWQEWENQTKKEKPVIYFIIYFVIYELSLILKNRIQDNLKCMRNKYFKTFHTVTYDVKRFTTNKNNHDKYDLRDFTYMDPSAQILYTNFQTLVNFIEHEAYMIEWKSSSEHQYAWKEMTELYIWWVRDRYIEQDNNKIPIYEDFGLTRDEYRKKYKNNDVSDEIQEKIKEYDNALSKYDKKSIEIERKEQDNLHRLIKIRQFMWT